jgi:hypothetical protein
MKMTRRAHVFGPFVRFFPDVAVGGDTTADGGPRRTQLRLTSPERAVYGWKVVLSRKSVVLYAAVAAWVGQQCGYH